MDWEKVEDFIGESVPNCIKTFLSVCAYDTFSSLQNISPESLNEIERHVNIKTEAIQGLDCCHSIVYKSQNQFKLLPGHRDFLLSMSTYKFINTQNDDSTATKNSTLPVVLQAMIQTCLQNAGSNKYHAHYNDLIRYFATYVFLSAGRSCYEFLRSNLNLPSTKTILRCIENSNSSFVEGKLRCQELSEYLEKIKAVKSVWICEDATAIISTIKFDPKTNQIVGILLPMNNKGCPIPFSFLATDADTIARYIKLPKSKFAYVVIAQSLDECVPPFILQMFGTGVGSFKSQDVLCRWDFTIEELEKYGIEVVGASSDGDPRLLAAMCAFAHIFMCGIGRELIVTQDHIHFRNKCRNRMLKNSIYLPMGKFEVSIKHLQSLVKDIQKSNHGLSQIDVCPVDRMNYESFEKITSDRAIEALQKHIKQSDATVQFLKICRDATLSYLRVDLNPIERIQKIWHALFFMRIWRNWIKSSPKYTLKNNFLTSNAYMCLEINARSMLRLIKKFRNENRSEQFLPTIFDSQANENIFRIFRTMGTTQFTKMNFSLYELMHLIRRVETLNDIAYIKLCDKNVHFPNKRTGKTIIFNLPSDNDIDATIVKARSEAIENARKLGMTTTDDIDEFEIHSNLRFDETDDDSEDCIEEIIEESDEVEDMDVEEFETDRMVVDVNSRFVIIHDENGIKRKIPKSTLIWMLTEPSEKISNDRLKRVQVHDK